MVVRAADVERARADELAIALVDALRGRGERAALPPGPPEPSRGEQEALEAAEADYQMLRPELATERLTAALARVDARGEGLSRDALLRAWLLLALARAATGDPTGADAAVDRALAIDPALVPDPVRYPPPLRERVDRRRDALGDARAPLEIDVQPEAARIELDGAPGGREARVAPGVHVVRAAAPGHRAEARAVDVGPEGARLALSLAIDPAAVLATPGAPGSETDTLRAAARALGQVALVVDLRVTRAGLVLDAHEESRTAHVRAALGAPAYDVVAAVLAALRAPVVAERGVDPVPWIAAGSALAAGAALAIAIGVALAGGEPRGFDARGTVVR